MKDFVLKKGASGSDLGNLQWFRGASAEAVNPFEEPEVPPIVLPVGYVISVASGMVSDGCIKLLFAGLSSPSPPARVMSASTMICRPQRIPTKFVAHAVRMGRPRR